MQLQFGTLPMFLFLRLLQIPRSPADFHCGNCTLTLAHHGSQLRIAQQISLQALPRGRRPSLGPRCKPTDTSWEEACIKDPCSSSSCLFAGMKCPSNEYACYSGLWRCFVHLQLQSRDMLNILSVTSGSCPCWGSVAQYLLPGRVLSCELVTTMSKKRTSDLLRGLFSFYTLITVPLF